MASGFGVGAANTFVSGQNNAGNNPFSLQPFGGTSPFGQQTGTSFFGNTSTGNFGQTSSLPSTTTFGGICSPFGGSSAFGQKPAFGGFGTNTQTNTFGSLSQQSQPAFGSNLLSSSSPFAASGQPSFGGTTTSPGFGATTTWAFGASTTPTFSGNTNPSLGFGSTLSSFGTPSSPFAQATTSTVASGGFGQPGGSRVAGYSNTSWQENGTNTKLQSISGMNVYKDKIHEELRWEDYQRGDKGGPTTAGMRFAPSSGQSNPFSSSTPFLQTTPNPFSANATTNPFSSSSTLFGQTTPNLFSANTTTKPSTAQITFTQTTPNPFSANATTFPSTTQSNPFSSSTSTTFLQTIPNPFSANATTNPSTTQSNPFSSSTSTTFLQTTPNPFSANATTNPSTSHSNPFSSTTLSAFAQTPNPFSANPTTFPSTAQTNPFNSSTSLTPSQFSANATPNPYNVQTGSSSWGKTGIFTPSPLNSFTASNLAQTSASSSAPSLQTLPVQTSTGINFSNLGTLPSNLFQPTLPAQTSNNFNFSNLAPNQSDGSGFRNGLNSTGLNVGQLSSNQKTAVAQPVAVINPFGTLPAMPHMSISNARTSSSVQYGISSMPVVDKPTPVRISPLLTSRLLSHHRLRVPARKYHPKHNGSRVAFFSDECEVPRTPNADAFLIPRENPRALIVQPIEHWPPNSCKKEASVVIHENGYVAKSESGEEQCHLDRRIQKPAGGFSDDSMNRKEDSHVTISGHRAGDPAIVYENTAEIEAIMPKLRHSEYYTEPQIQELATKERDEPGFCSHVNNFVVGRRGYGSIKFLWNTDVRHLDLDSLVQFNNREVIVYMDDSKKPPVGQGLNKPAEVTLLNIKCYDKKTGNQILEGPRIEKYKEMLKKKSEDQGAEFLSYHPVNGEWKFRVSHF